MPGRQDSNLGMAESKSNDFRLSINEHSEKSGECDVMALMLGEQLKELSTLELEFDLETIGFTMGEIDLRIEGLAPSPDADRADTLPPASELTISQTGDLWQLDRHRLYCSNALDSRSYAVLMKSERAALALTDPPYNVKIFGHASGRGAVRHREFAMASGEMDEVEFADFLSRSLHLMAEHSIDGAIHFVFMDWRHAGELLVAGRRVYSELKNLCVWVKHNAGMGSFYRSQHELVFVFKYGRGPHRNNIELGRFGRNRSNVWTYPGANSFGRGRGR